MDRTDPRAEDQDGKDSDSSDDGSESSDDGEVNDPLTRTDVEAPAASSRADADG